MEKIKKSNMKDILEKTVEKSPEMVSMWIFLIQQKGCFWCKKKFEEGIVRKDLGGSLFNKKNMSFMLTPEFLVHAQTTHGYDPETIQNFIDKILDK